jgi:hypothetical protein
VRPEGLGKFEKIHFIRTRSRDLPACSIMPQPLRYHVRWLWLVCENISTCVVMKYDTVTTNGVLGMMSEEPLITIQGHITAVFKCEDFEKISRQPVTGRD